MAPTGQFWTWQGHQIHYVQMGQASSRPPLLFVHGFGASTDHWKKNLLGLQDEFEVWAIDLLGFGRSSKADTEYSAQLWCQQLSDFITHVMARPAVVVGNSIGGYVALATNARFPEQTCGAVLLNPAGGFSQDISRRAPSTPAQQVMSRTMQGLLQQDWFTWLIFKYVQNKAFIRKTLRQVYVNQAAVTEELVEAIYRPSCDRGAARVFASVFRAPKGEPIDHLLGQLRHPLLLLWGEKDPWLGNAQARSAQFRQFYPRVQEVFLNAGHCPHDDVPDQVNQHLQSWVLQTVLQDA
jgi:pimeloyl-ACP methyl ester carboxylesterase